jgi:hypothetical protein
LNASVTVNNSLEDYKKVMIESKLTFETSVIDNETGPILDDSEEDLGSGLLIDEFFSGKSLQKGSASNFSNSGYAKNLK